MSLRRAVLGTLLTATLTCYLRACHKPRHHAMRCMQETWRGCRARVCGTWLRVAHQAMMGPAASNAPAASTAAAAPFAAGAAPSAAAAERPEARGLLPRPQQPAASSPPAAVHRFRMESYSASVALASELAKWLQSAPRRKVQQESLPPPASTLPPTHAHTAGAAATAQRHEGVAGPCLCTPGSAARAGGAAADLGAVDGSSTCGRGAVQPESSALAGSASAAGGAAGRADEGRDGLEASLQPLLLRPVCQALWWVSRWARLVVGAVGAAGGGASVRLSCSQRMTERRVAKRGSVLLYQYGVWNGGRLRVQLVHAGTTRLQVCGDKVGSGPTYHERAAEIKPIATALIVVAWLDVRDSRAIRTAVDVSACLKAWLYRIVRIGRSPAGARGPSCGCAAGNHTLHVISNWSRAECAGGPHRRTQSQLNRYVHFVRPMRRHHNPPCPCQTRS